MLSLDRRAHLVVKTAGAGAIIDADHLREPMARVLCVVLEEAPALAGNALVVTSGRDSHAKGSHPRGLALDFRGKTIVAPNLAERRRRGRLWGARVQARLGADYVVLFEEHSQSARDHLHVQLTPRVRRAFTPGFFQRVQHARRGGLLD